MSCRHCCTASSHVLAPMLSSAGLKLHRPALRPAKLKGLLYRIEHMSPCSCRLALPSWRGQHAALFYRQLISLWLSRLVSVLTQQPHLMDFTSTEALPPHPVACRLYKGCCAAVGTCGHRPLTQTLTAPHPPYHAADPRLWASCMASSRHMDTTARPGLRRRCSALQPANLLQRSRPTCPFCSQPRTEALPPCPAARRICCIPEGQGDSRGDHDPVMQQRSCAGLQRGAFHDHSAHIQHRFSCAGRNKGPGPAGRFCPTLW